MGDNTDIVGWLQDVAGTPEMVIPVDGPRLREAADVIESLRAVRSVTPDQIAEGARALRVVYGIHGVVGDDGSYRNAARVVLEAVLRAVLGGEETEPEAAGGLAKLVRKYELWQSAMNDGDTFAGDYAHSSFVSELQRLADVHLPARSVSEVQVEAAARAACDAWAGNQTTELWSPLWLIVARAALGAALTDQETPT